MLKDEEAKKIPGRSDTQYSGIRLKSYSYKTRYSKPFQSVSIEVPYETGMDPYNGLLEAAVATGVVEQGGAWYTFGDQKFQRKNFDQYKETILQEMIARESDTVLEYNLEGEYVDALEGAASPSERRKKLLLESIEKTRIED